MTGRRSDNASSSATISSSPQEQQRAGHIKFKKGLKEEVKERRNSRLHLVDTVGKISLAEVTLTEDPSEEDRIDEGNEKGSVEKHSTFFP